MEISSQILSQITIFNKYAKFLPSLNRRETWDEICDRYENMMVDKYPDQKDNISVGMEFIKEKKVLPSMRALQFAGPAIKKNNSRLYNCAYFPIDDFRAFSEAMFLLLGGTGVGFSVQFHHVDKLPDIYKPVKERKYLIGDSLEGWADAIKALMKAYFGLTRYKPSFDFTDIRAKGARLVTAGGKAPGPAPLKECLVKIENILDSKSNGEKLKPIECHDIICYIANAVLSGGIRRSACISLFSFDDIEMTECKYGNWWELNEQRGRANNSAVILRNKVKKSEFLELWNKVEMSNAGEPGIYFTNDKDWGTNPCCEIALRPFQFCNLCELNVSNIIDEEDITKRAAVAAYFGTLQAGFTDFHYLRPIWRQTTEKDALIGVGMTGIASGVILGYDLEKLAEQVKQSNEATAKMININKAARTTTIKPSGTSSCVLGVSSGIHAWHNDYYIRRIRIMKNDPLYTYLIINHPKLVEDDKMRTHDTAVISIPQKAPEGSILRTESALELLERVKKFNLEWVREGHRKGANTNNVSATISVDKNKKYAIASKKELEECGQPCTKDHAKDEWVMVGKWMWENKSTFNGLSVLPYDNGSYIQAPFTDCTKEEYEGMMKSLTALDLTKVVEIDDNTEHSQEAACAGGLCSI
jgi:ribonucleoside-triphosphate reductase